MQTENRLLDDLARMANGALQYASGVREEIESRVRERVERMLADMDMVPREEFEAVRAMAQTARSEQEEDLAVRVAEARAPARRARGSRSAGDPQGGDWQVGDREAGHAQEAQAGGDPQPACGPKTAAKPTSE